MRLASLFAFAFLASGATAQDAPTADETALQAARATTCAAFLSEVARHTAAGGQAGTTPSFAIIWGALLKADTGSSGYMGKIGLGRTMFQNTEHTCQRIRGRTLGATMDAEYAAL